MRIGSARVKTGGINTVRTEEPHRLKGYSTLVMNHALARMAREKYAMSVLLGIPDFYHRFGYAPIMANTNLFVATEDLLRSDPIVPVSTMKKSDGAAVRRLYNQLNATRTASHVRPNYWTHLAGNFRVLPGALQDPTK
jgi:predicted acetyltransferase